LRLGADEAVRHGHLVGRGTLLPGGALGARDGDVVDAADVDGDDVGDVERPGPFRNLEDAFAPCPSAELPQTPQAAGLGKDVCGIGAHDRLGEGAVDVEIHPAAAEQNLVSALVGPAFGNRLEDDVV